MSSHLSSKTSLLQHTAVGFSWWNMWLCYKGNPLLCNRCVPNRTKQSYIFVLLTLRYAGVTLVPSTFVDVDLRFLALHILFVSILLVYDVARVAC